MPGIDRAEALRYMRMGGAEPDAEMLRRLEPVERGVSAALRPAVCWSIAPVEVRADASGARVGSMDIDSRDLARVLAGCRRAVLFAATLGAGVDAYLRRCAMTSAADLVMAQGVAAALVESCCDEAEKAMLATDALRGAGLRPRYSPGYGDLALDVQRPLLAELDASRRAGISLTDTLLMVPSKSVSAIIGVIDAA